MYDDASNDLNDDFDDRLNWIEVLVTEICLLCIRRNLVDRIIGLPWNVDEEKHLHKCLLDCALDDPLSNTGSLLVVFYLQRYQYAEAYQVDRKLQNFEKDFVSRNPVDEAVAQRLSSTQHWRAGLVDKSIQLLPEVEQQKVKSGQITELVSSENDNIASENHNHHEVPVPSYTNSSIILRMSNETPPPKSYIGGFQTMVVLRFYKRMPLTIQKEG